MGKKILIVDDASFTRMMLKELLQKNGYDEVFEAVDGQDAVNTYEIERPDVVLMDVLMPHMDGIDTLQAILALNKKAKIIMCTAMGQESIVLQSIRYGAVDFIVKPYKDERVLQAVQRAIG